MNKKNIIVVLIIIVVIVAIILGIKLIFDNKKIEENNINNNILNQGNHQDDRNMLTEGINTENKIEGIAPDTSPSPSIEETKGPEE